jgi:hypothetical protein
VYLKGLLHVCFNWFGGGLVVETHILGLQTRQRSDVPQPSAVEKVKVSLTNLYKKALGILKKKLAYGLHIQV